MKKVPSNIEKVIQVKSVAMQAERAEKDEKEATHRREQLATGREKIAKLFEEFKAKVPNYLHFYMVTEVEQYWTEDRIIQILEYHHPFECHPVFNIPGLSLIKFDGTSDWMCQNAYDSEWGGSPVMTFNNSHWYADVEYVLVQARIAWLQHQENVSKEAERNAQTARDCAMKDAREAIEFAKFQAEEVREQAEKHRQHDELVKFLDENPEAVYLLKTFVQIQANRGRHQDAIERVHEMMENAEYASERRAELYRRELQDAEQRVQRETEERQRAEWEAEDANKALKKAKDEANQF